jgi:hypothetical protein
MTRVSYGFLTPSESHLAPCFHVLPTTTPHHSHLPFSINCSHFISPSFYTYKHLLPSFLRPPFPPIVSQPKPCIPILIFAFCSFYDYPFATITISHYIISNYIVFHPQPLDSSSDHPSAFVCPPQLPIFTFSSFHEPDPLLWSSCSTITLIVPPNYNPCYRPSRLLVVKEMVFANHIKCYGLVKLFIVIGKLS